MKLISLYSAVTLFALTTYALVIPTPSGSQDYTVFKWEKDSYSKSFSVDLNSLSRVHISDLNTDGKGFRVYDNGKFIGEASVGKNMVVSPSSEDKYHYRQGYFNLEKGHHLIEIELKKASKGKGSGMIRIIPGKFEEWYSADQLLTKFL
jgi:hypothetical protein